MALSSIRIPFSSTRQLSWCLTGQRNLRLRSAFFTAIVQLLAPGGERVLWADNLEFDFRLQTTYLMTLILHDIQLIDIGTYEFHVLLEEYAMLGEWGRASLTISEA